MHILYCICLFSASLTVICRPRRRLLQVLRVLRAWFSMEQWQTWRMDMSVNVSWRLVCFLCSLTNRDWCYWKEGSLTAIETSQHRSCFDSQGAVFALVSTAQVRLILGQKMSTSVDKAHIHLHWHHFWPERHERIYTVYLGTYYPTIPTIPDQ